MNAESLTIIEKALKIMEEGFLYGEEKITGTKSAEDYFRLKLGNKKEEAFCVAFLNNQNKVLALEELGKGTINACNVHPRSIVRRVIEINAAKVILSHNHPSGNEVFSSADIEMTKTIKNILEIIDCEVIDHIVVTALKANSMRNSEYSYIF
jgi:DNA repair protein RadC